MIAVLHTLATAGNAAEIAGHITLGDVLGWLAILTPIAAVFALVTTATWQWFSMKQAIKANTDRVKEVDQRHTERMAELQKAIGETNAAQAVLNNKHAEAFAKIVEQLHITDTDVQVLKANLDNHIDKGGNG